VLHVFIADCFVLFVCGDRVRNNTVNSTLTLDDLLHDKRQREQEEQQDRQEEKHQDENQKEVCVIVVLLIFNYILYTARNLSI